MYHSHSHSNYAHTRQTKISWHDLHTMQLRPYILYIVQLTLFLSCSDAVGYVKLINNNNNNNNYHKKERKKGLHTKVMKNVVAVFCFNKKKDFYFNLIENSQ